MSNGNKPSNSISKIKLPGENTGRPIVPYHVGYASNNNYVATLPQLSSDVHFVIDDQTQDINGYKTFTNPIGLYDPVEDQNIRIWASDTQFTIYADCTDNYIAFDLSSDQLHIYYHDAYNGIGYNYLFPTQSGTLGLQIDIVDLT